jgi:hypothetical protein
MRSTPFAVAIVCLAVMPRIVQAQGAPPEDKTFIERLVQEYRDGFFPPPGVDTTPVPVPSVCLQGPLESPPFPSTNFSFGGNPGMCQDGTPDRGPLIKALGPTAVGRWLDTNRISLYGWVEPGFDISTSQKTKGGNAPAAYDFNANAGFLNQATFYIDRLPDTIQTDHVDWGFRLTSIYGTDYRYTTMYGLASNQLLKENHWAGWDLPMAYGDIYVPYILNGMNIRFGRYISLPDVEAQLAPDNYFYSHSILYSTDPYTQIGVVTTTKLDPKGQWAIQFGISAGNDVTPWSGHNLVQPTLTAGINYTTPSTHDNVYLTANSTNNQKFGYNNLQSFYLTWYHVFDNPKFHIATEAWYMFQDKTPNAPDAVVFPFYGENGPFGAYCNTGTRCQSHEWAVLNYAMYDIDRHNAVGIRNEYYDDASGQRTGFKTAYYEATVSWQHYFSDDVYIRPEIGYYHAFNAAVFSGATRKDLTMFSADIIWRY